MIRILFVCTGNIFRSFSAERLCKVIAPENWSITSAGTGVNPNDRCLGIEQTLTLLGADALHHQPRQVTKEILEEADFIIAMDEQHQRFLQERFGVHAKLFLDVAWGIKKGILDTDDILTEETWDEMHDTYVLEVVLAIKASMQPLLRNLQKSMC